MTVEIICVGTELLLGNIVNTNAAYLAEKCASLGLSCYFQSVVGDNEERLTKVLECAVDRSDIVILSGGLGPSEDDLTKEVAAKVCGKALKVDECSMERIAEYFAARDIQPTENSWKQAMIPEGAIVLDNNNGTAPGVIIESENTRVILLPGPPNELVPMFEEGVAPYLEQLTPGVICSQTVKICGVGESQAETMEKAVVDLLLANKLTVTCAESCTGGLLSSRLINVAGVSECYKAGFVTYSNKSKRKLLGVKKSTLDKYGAVSVRTAEEMAKGAALAAKADVAVAITGIAGPDGGTKDKPVGLVYIACNVKDLVTVEKFQFKGNRSKIREASASAALELMRRCILEYFSKVTFGKKK